MTAMLGYLNLLDVATSVTSSGGSLAGFEATKVRTERLDEYWAPQATPDTLTIDMGSNRSVRVVVLVGATGLTFLSNPVVVLRTALAGGIVATLSVSYPPAYQLPDRRFFVLPTAVSCRYVQVQLSLGDALARVMVCDVMDLTRTLQTDFESGEVDMDEPQSQDGPGDYQFPTDLPAPRRWKSGLYKLRGVSAGECFAEEQFVASGSLLTGPLVLSAVAKSLLVMFDRQGLTREIVMLPMVPSGTSADDLKFLSQTAIYGHLTKALDFTYIGVRSADSQTLWNVDLDVEELI